MGIHCHCDHCQNNTCVTHEDGQCYGQIILNDNEEIERKLNCFNLNSSSLVVTLTCDDDNRGYGITERSFFKCCKTENFCNSKDDFLPSDDEARKLMTSHHKQTPTRNIYQNNNNQQTNGLSRTSTTGSSSSSRINSSTSRQVSTLDQYSNIPNEMKLAFVVLSGLLLIVALALGQGCLSSRRRRHRSRNDLHTPAHHSGCSHQSLANNSQTIHSAANEDHSENSSDKVISEVAIYDTNSVASREPLIQNSMNTNTSCCDHHNPVSMSQASSLGHPHPLRGPYMGEDPSSSKTKTMSTFQMSIGSGDMQGQKKFETSSGSGAGQPYLTQRSIAHDIELAEVVGRGYFGVVWRGEYKGEPVAVKIFSAMAEPNWAREAEIYQTTLLRHKNILGFIATDKRDDIGVTGYWLVTDYYPMGSLYDFLKRNSTSMLDAVRMSFSIANGLSHLHVEIFGTRAKPAIAHRDLKSKNILVKTDGTCCIADLGMAVRYNSSTGIVDVPSNTRVGTRRYLAPETLENKLNLMDFEAVKATDVYSLGLVLWEILRRACYMPALTGGDQQQQQSENLDPAIVCEPYEAPYQNHVSADPTTEEMYRVVCVEKVRPPQSSRWSKFPPMAEFSTLMRECWYEKPQARLSALRVRKTLGDMARHYYNSNMEYD